MDCAGWSFYAKRKAPAWKLGRLRNSSKSELTHDAWTPVQSDKMRPQHCRAIAGSGSLGADWILESHGFLVSRVFISPQIEKVRKKQNVMDEASAAFSPADLWRIWGPNTTDTHAW